METQLDSGEGNKSLAVWGEGWGLGKSIADHGWTELMTLV